MLVRNLQLLLLYCLGFLLLLVSMKFLLVTFSSDKELKHSLIEKFKHSKHSFRFFFLVRCSSLNFNEVLIALNSRLLEPVTEVQLVGMFIT